MNKLMNLLADATATGAAEAAAEEMSTGAMIIYYAVQFLPMILIFVVFYFMLIRPQRKKDKEAKQMLVDNRALLDEISAYLLEKESITGEELMAFVDKPASSGEITEA